MRIAEPLLALAFLFMSAFFAAAETALVTLSPQKTKQLALRNPKLTNHLVGWLARPHELIIVILTGSTIAIVMFAALLTSASFKVFHAYPRHPVEVVDWLVQTALMLIFGELVPKFLGRIYPERISLFALPWLARARRVFAPLLNITTRLIGLFMPAWISPPVGSYLTFSMDELRLLLEETKPGNAPQTESLTMMQRALELTKKTVQEIMTKIENVDTVDLDIPMDRNDLIDLIVENGHTRIPVRIDKKFMGYLHTHDLLALMIEDRGQNLDSMVVGMPSFHHTMKVSEILQVFKTSSVHIGLVRSPDNEVIGIVTLEDVMEEITGEILDEYDVFQSKGGGAS